MGDRRNSESPLGTIGDPALGTVREPTLSAARGRAGIGGGSRWLQGGEKPKNQGAALRRLWTFFGSERKRLRVVISLVFVDSILLVFLPRLIGMTVDTLTALGTSTKIPTPGAPRHVLPLDLALALLVGAYITDTLITILQGRIMAAAAQGIVLNLRKTLFSKLQRLPVAYFDTHSHGDMMSRLANDVDNISTTIAQSTSQLIATVITLTGSLIMMLILSPLLTLTALITVPLVFILTRVVVKRTRLLFREQQNVLGTLNGHIEETISGIEVVKAFNREGNALRDFMGTNNRLRTVGTQAQIWSGFVMPLMNVINNLGFVAVAVSGGILAVAERITVGTIASFLAYSRQFTRPLNDLANIYNSLQTALAGAERVFEILDEAEEIPDPPGAVDIRELNLRGKVEFDRVFFEYQVGRPIIKNIVLKVPEGSVVALVGPTGAGKTTIANLLARFYNPSEGTIRLDDRDTRTYQRDTFRRAFGIVLQDSYLFSGTIGDNIRYGNPGASPGEIRSAAESANAAHFIECLPRGYDTELREGGAPLSEGQRQLVAIARAVLANPRILILDEATSNVDTRTELHIQHALTNLMKGHTSFIIAHRLSTIRWADRILVIDGGQIIESGNHEELLAQGGLYSRMYRDQA